MMGIVQGGGGVGHQASTQVHRWVLSTTLVVLVLCCVPQVMADEPGVPRVSYGIGALLSLKDPHVEGTVEVRFINHSDRTLTKAVFILFPNRFASPDEAVNDFNRPLVYPEEKFVAGSMEITEASVEGIPTTVAPLEHPNLPPGTAAAVGIPAVAPGDTQTVTLRFRTRVPYRFGSFGLFEDQLTLTGGWHPQLAALDEDGTWLIDQPPPPAKFKVGFTSSPDLKILLNGRECAGDSSEPVSVTAHYLSLLAAPEWLRDETTAGATRIVLYHRPERRSFRLSFGASDTELLLDALRDIVSRRPDSAPEPPEELVVAQAPLRFQLTEQGEGAVLVSDRVLKVYGPLGDFHRADLAAAVYREVLRPHLFATQGRAEYWWASEAAAHVLARFYIDSVRPGRRGLYDWIDLFNVFAVVDRFESEPRIPFRDTFFGHARSVDPLRQRIATFNVNRPPGSVVIDKVREWVGAEEFDAFVAPCLKGRLPFGACIGGVVAGRDLDDLLALWLGPYPAINYSVESVDLNRKDFGRYRQALVVRRKSSHPFTEPVTVRLQNFSGGNVDLQWKSGGGIARMSAVTDEKMRQVVIDPERKLIDDDRRDNFRPPSPQVVLDSADIEISSTEFGLAGMLVGRARYDYQKDLAVAGVYTNRGVGFTAGARGHWGEPINPTLYRHNAYLFYGLKWLDGSFHEKGGSRDRTDGRLGSVGLRYDYTDVFSAENPTSARNLSLFADFRDRSLGSDFNYVDWGYKVSFTHRLWGYRTLGALQVVNGFSERLGSSEVPQQGLYSLGGSRSIRGIDAEAELGRNIFVLRGELRHTLYPELDWNLFDFLVLRRLQVRLFADAGRVHDKATHVYNVEEFAAGAGVGLAAAYDFMGFVPLMAYVQIGTRVDQSSDLDDIQVLFGTKQAF